MKKQLFALLGLGLLLANAPAYAQDIHLKANIPFDFVVNGSALPSGEYTIRSSNSLGRLLSMSGGERSILVLANPSRSLKASAQSKLVFIHDGDRYFLSEMWMEGSSAGVELPKNRRPVQVGENTPVEQGVILAELR
ncbi:MAG TPA: hypothetical protein VEI52_11075 [Terriglobales bacterium]|nr:hypothetical protein [Terriglobales bacterium]